MTKRRLTPIEKRRLELFTALNLRMNGPEEGFIWDSMCLTHGLEEESEKVSCVAMYLKSGVEGEITFEFFNAPGGVESLALATALFTLEPLEPVLEQAMRERDQQLVTAGGFMEGGLESDAFRMALREKLQATDFTEGGAPLPVAFVWLSTGISLRRHLDFYCYAGVPALPMWSLFRSNVVAGVIALY